MKTAQHDIILELLERGHRITGADAFRLAGTMKLATRVSELRRMGHDIKMDWIESEGKRYGQYYMEKGNG